MYFIVRIEKIIIIIYKYFVNLLEVLLNRIDIEIEPSQSLQTEYIDEIGIKWLVAKGGITKVEMSRNEPDDDRWSKKC